MATSALVRVVTRLEVDALLFGATLSVLVVLMVAVRLSVVPDAVVVLTWTCGEKVAVAPAASEAMVQVMFPLAPTTGVVHDQPAGGVSERKFAPAGMGMVTETFAAAPGPLFTADAV